MKLQFSAAIVALLSAAPATADGDVEAGEKSFKRCKACHSIVTPEGDVLFKGGKTGPNLYGVVGRTIGSEDFKYGPGLLEAKDSGATWTNETLAAFITDPKAWLGDNDYATKTKMTFKMKKGGSDVAAYLASLAPEVVEETTEEEVKSE